MSRSLLNGRSLGLVLALATFGSSACVPSRSDLRSPVDAELARRLGRPPSSTVLRRRSPSCSQSRSTARTPCASRSPTARGCARRSPSSASRVATSPPRSGSVRSNAELYLRFGTSNHRARARCDPEPDGPGHVRASSRRRALRSRRRARERRGHRAAPRRKVEIAFHDLIAAQQEVELRRTAFDAADAAALMRERMHDAGNTSDLAQARDRDAREQARVDLGRAEAERRVAREQLNALLRPHRRSDEVDRAPARCRSTRRRRRRSTISRPPPSPRASSWPPATRRSTLRKNRAGAERVRAFLPDFGARRVRSSTTAPARSRPRREHRIPLLDQRAGQRARANAEVARAEHGSPRRPSSFAPTPALPADRRARRLRGGAPPARCRAAAAPADRRSDAAPLQRDGRRPVRADRRAPRARRRRPPVPRCAPPLLERDGRGPHAPPRRAARRRRVGADERSTSTDESH